MTVTKDAFEVIDCVKETCDGDSDVANKVLGIHISIPALGDSRMRNAHRALL
jgi:hypothetical protein